jgi:CheY-like chemotaxis protein
VTGSVNGQITLNLSTVAPVNVVEAAIEAIAPAAESKGVQVTNHVEGRVGDVQADSQRLQQVVWNLLANAVRFTPQGGWVDVAVRQTHDATQIIVGDTGAGISADFLPHVFDRFRQGQTGTTRSHGGLGLGLSIVRHLVELHGGTVRAESKGEDHGAVFTVTLPLALANDGSGNRAKDAENIAQENPDLTGLRVLVVDDDTDTLEILELMLSQYGAEVRTSDSSAGAYETLLEWKPSVIVSDIGMPNEDGYTLIGKIRDLTPEKGGNIPAAALTAYVSEGDRLQALAAGFQTHISKPVEPIFLAETVAELAKSAET